MAVSDSTRYPPNPSSNRPSINCRGCGGELDPSEDQVNAAVDQVLETSLEDAEKTGGVCPLCGHSKQVPYSHRKTVLFGLLLAWPLVSIVVGMGIQRSRQTQREAVAEEAVARMATIEETARFPRRPITVESGMKGEIKQD